MHVLSSGRCGVFGTHYQSFLGALLEAPGFVFCGQAWETNRRFFHLVYKNLELVSAAVVIFPCFRASLLSLALLQVLTKSLLGVGFTCLVVSRVQP